MGLGLGVESSSGGDETSLGVKDKGQAPQGGRKPAFIHYSSHLKLLAILPCDSSFIAIRISK